MASTMVVDEGEADSEFKYLPSTKRGRERREKILAAAEAVFFEMGFEATSVGEIVRRSGGSLATLYKMFGRKEELFESLVVARVQSLCNTLSVDRLSNLPPTEVLMQVGRTLTDICISDHGVAIFRIVMAEASRFPTLGTIFFEKGINIVQRDLARYFARQVQLGALTLDNPSIAARVFLEMVKGDVQLRMCCGEPPPARQVIDRQIEIAVNLFLRGAQPCLAKN